MMISRESAIKTIIAGLSGFLVKYMAYGFMTAVVLLTFAALMFDYITIRGPGVPFVRYISFLLPIDPRGNATLDEGDVMQAYALLTAILLALSLMGKGLIWIFKRATGGLFSRDEERGPSAQNNSVIASVFRTAWRQFLFSFAIISLPFLVAFFVIPIAPLADPGELVPMYVIFGLFYVIAVAANAITVAIDSIANLLLSWAIANFAR
jgi:hypothetical protein